MIWASDINLHANPGFVAVVFVVFVGLVFLVLKGATSIKTSVAEVRLGVKDIDEKVEQVNRQVNHVDDPENEPTVRELAIGQTEELAEQTRILLKLAARQEQQGAELRRTRIAQEDQQGQLAGLAKLVAGQGAAFADHLDYHDRKDAEDARARAGEIERRATSGTGGSPSLDEYGDVP